MADDYKNPAESFSSNTVSFLHFTSSFGTAGNDTRVCKESVLQSLLECVFTIGGGIFNGRTSFCQYLLRSAGTTHVLCMFHNHNPTMQATDDDDEEEEEEATRSTRYVLHSTNYVQYHGESDDSSAPQQQEVFELR